MTTSDELKQTMRTLGRPTSFEELSPAASALDSTEQQALCIWDESVYTVKSVPVPSTSLDAVFATMHHITLKAQEEAEPFSLPAEFQALLCEGEVPLSRWVTFQDRTLGAHRVYYTVYQTKKETKG